MDKAKEKFFHNYGVFLTSVIEHDGRAAGMLAPQVETATHTVMEVREKFHLHSIGRIPQGESRQDWYMIVRQLIGVANHAHCSGLLDIGDAATALVDEGIEIVKKTIPEEEMIHEHA